MAEENEPQGEGTQEENSGDSREAEFWKKMSKTIDERVDAGIERAVKKHMPLGSSRSGTRQSSIPGLFADFMFGKAKD